MKIPGAVVERVLGYQQYRPDQGRFHERLPKLPVLYWLPGSRYSTRWQPGLKAIGPDGSSWDHVLHPPPIRPWRTRHAGIPLRSLPKYGVTL